MPYTCEAAGSAAVASGHAPRIITLRGLPLAAYVT
jgi:hypothetical protein